MATTGRPPIDWTPSRKRKLIRLYLCSNMALRDICEVLQEDGFQPKLRKTQDVLAELLSPKYNTLRPIDRDAMKARMAELRHCKVKRAGLNFTALSATKIQFTAFPTFEDSLENFSGTPPNPVSEVGGDSVESTGTINKNRLSAKYTSTFIEDCASLLKRISLASSSKSSTILSSLEQIRSSSSSRYCGEQPLPLDWIFKSSDTDIRESSSNQDFLNTCCSLRELCIHRLVAHFTSLCSAYTCGIYLGLSISIDANESDTLGNRPLHIAAGWGTSFTVLNLLIMRGADVYAINNAGQNFMHVIDPTNLLEQGEFGLLCSTLASRGFQFDSRDYSGRSILLSILEDHVIQVAKESKNDGKIRKHLEILFELLVTEQNCWNSVHAQDNNQKSVALYLHVKSIFEGDFEFYSMLLTNYCLRTTRAKYKELLNLYPSSFLHLANPVLHYATVYESLFCSDSQQWNVEDVNPETLHELARSKSWPHVPISGKNINTVDASFIIRQKRMGSLLMWGVDADGYDATGQTPLMAFVTHFRNEESDQHTGALIQKLIDHGACVHRRDRNGETALHKAVKYGRKSATECLLRNGANINVEARNGETVRDIAYKYVGSRKSNVARYGKILACMNTIVEQNRKELFSNSSFTSMS